MPSEQEQLQKMPQSEPDWEERSSKFIEEIELQKEI